MIWMVVGLVLFLGVHSTRIFADGWRTKQITQRGENVWKGIYALLALAGLGLVVYGYGLARMEPTLLWAPPVWTRHVAALFTLPAFILIAAAYVPGTHMRAKLGHPMLLGTKLWAFAHLLSNGNLADVILFGSFLVWAIVLFAKSRRRDRAAGTTYTEVGASRDVMAVVAGSALWALFAMWLHAMLIGVAPFG